MIYTPMTKKALKLCFETHRDQVDKTGMPYMDYVRAIKSNPVARKVKIADLTHNSDSTRVDEIDERMLERWKKYREALRILNE